MFDVFNESIPMFEKVSQLSLALSNVCWYSVPNLMMKFPNLKTLIIEVGIYMTTVITYLLFENLESQL